MAGCGRMSRGNMWVRPGRISRGGDRPAIQARCTPRRHSASDTTACLQAHRSNCLRRIALITTAAVFALAHATAPAQDSLPDIGSSVGRLLTPHQQEEYGSMLLAQLRHYEYVLEDPLVDDWLDTLGTRLAANSDNPKQPFTFFMLRE